MRRLLNFYNDSPNETEIHVSTKYQYRFYQKCSYKKNSDYAHYEFVTSHKLKTWYKV